MKVIDPLLLLPAVQPPPLGTHSIEPARSGKEVSLEDPYQDISLRQNFFHWNNLQSTVIDTHFYERDRMGRLMTFVARLLRDGRSSDALGIGIDEGTSLIVDQNGLATVVGDNFVYFVLGDHLPKKCEPQKPLTFRNFKIWKLFWSS